MDPIGPYIGCAGWSVPTAYAAQFPTTGTHLERYSKRFRAVEINSSFYRPHRVTTYARWAASVPEHFRFAVKIPKEITHGLRLQNASSVLMRFLSEVAGLGEKQGPLLVQLPPSLRFEAAIAERFFIALRQGTLSQVVCEPRHASWFTDEAEQLLTSFEVARVAADPALSSHAAVPGGWKGLVYFRLHGSPRMYYSSYSLAYIEQLTHSLRGYVHAALPAWCIFDNTAAFAATDNALQLLNLWSPLPG